MKEQKRMRIGARDFDTEHHTYLMAIVNVTPDSFYEGSRHTDPDDLVRTVLRMEKEGADLIDLGAESTRPGHIAVSEQEEMDRLLPALELIRENTDIPVSADTTKAAVAREALAAGCNLINTVEGLIDAEMAAYIREAGAACCLMHNRKEPVYADFAADFQEDMKQIFANALSLGISKDRIILDPGIGFAKSTEQNLMVLQKMKEWMIPGIPWLLGTSRKSVIGNTLGLPAGERLEGTLTTTVLAVMAGCSFVRVHDVKENKRCILMTEAIRDCGR